MPEFICLYSVEIENGKDHWDIKRGMLFADNFVDAVTQLETNLYGQDLMKINELELFDAIPEFSEETFRSIKHELEG